MTRRDLVTVLQSCVVASEPALEAGELGAHEALLVVKALAETAVRAYEEEAA